MDKFHKACLEKICYHCGLRYKTNLTTLQKKRHISAVEASDPNRTELSTIPLPTTHRYCYKCKTEYFTPLNKASRKPVVENLLKKIVETAYIFKPHTADCEICDQFSDLQPNEAEGGEESTSEPEEESIEEYESSSDEGEKLKLFLE